MNGRKKTNTLFLSLLFLSSAAWSQLGGTPGQYIKIGENGGDAGGNAFVNNRWLLRTAAGTGWPTAQLVDGISVDNSYTDPSSTRTWWKRDAYNNVHAWGDNVSTYLIINQGKVGVGTATPVSMLDVSVGTPTTITTALSVYRGADPNQGIKLLTGTGDDVSYSSWNGGLGGWNGIAFHCTLDNITRGIFDTRLGNFSLKGSIIADKDAIFKGSVQLGVDQVGTSTIAGPAYGGAIQIKTNSAVGGAANRFLRLGFRDNLGAFIPSISINDDSNVGIGTTTPDAKLAVKGTVHANEVKVDLNVPGPDYVFEASYPLPSLDSIQSYIDKNKHLPEIPSAKEMETNGVNLGEMNMLLLKKIEELTLHLIELKKENENQNILIKQILNKCQ